MEEVNTNLFELVYYVKEERPDDCKSFQSAGFYILMRLEEMTKKKKKWM